MPVRYVTLLCTIGIAGLFTAAEGYGQPPPSQLSIVFEKGRVSATIRNHSLQRVLHQVSLATKVEFILAPGIGDRPISLELKNVALDELLRRVLNSYDAFYYYGGSEEAPAALRRVWVYAKDAAVAARPLPPEAWAGGRDLEELSTDSDPEVRAQAYEALMSRPDPRSRELVLQALRGSREKDADLRQRILSSAFTKGLDVPSDLLVDLARADPSEQMRWMALDALSQNVSVRYAAEAALTDTSQAVRERAKEILAELEAAKLREKRP
jgi:hypothetical protein